MKLAAVLAGTAGHFVTCVVGPLIGCSVAVLLFARMCAAEQKR